MNWGLRLFQLGLLLACVGLITWVALGLRSSRQVLSNDAFVQNGKQTGEGLSDGPEPHTSSAFRLSKATVNPEQNPFRSLHLESTLKAREAARLEALAAEKAKALAAAQAKAPVIVPTPPPPKPVAPPKPVIPPPKPIVHRLVYRGLIRASVDQEQVLLQSGDAPSVLLRPGDTHNEFRITSVEVRQLGLTHPRLGEVTLVLGQVAELTEKPPEEKSP